MAQKPVLRGEVGCACVAREVSVKSQIEFEFDTTKKTGGGTSPRLLALRLAHSSLDQHLSYVGFS